MANEVQITIKAKDDTSGAFASVKRNATGLNAVFDSVSSAADKSFSKIKDSLNKALSGGGNDSSAMGRKVGTELVGGMATAVVSGASEVGNAMTRVMSGAASGAVSTPVIGPIITAGLIAALVAAAVIVGPIVGAALGGAIVLGFGAGLVGLGAVLLLQNEKLKAEFSKTWTEIKSIMTEAFQPLIPVLRTVMDVAKGLAKEFAPVIKSAMELAKGPLQSFVKDLGKSFSELKPSIEPMMKAFTDLLNVIGPQLPGIFSQVSEAISGLAVAVSANKDGIGLIFTTLLQLAPLAINLVTGLVNAFGALLAVAQSGYAAMQTFAIGVGIAFSNAIQGILGAVKAVTDTLARWIPALAPVFNTISAGLSAAINQLGEFNKVGAMAQNAIKIKADITDLTAKLNQAKAELNDPSITKERRAQLNADITKLTAAKAQAIMQLRDPALIKTYTAKFNAEITQLKSQIAIAKKELANKDLTRERKAKINADIASLQSRLRAAQAAVNSLKGKTITVTVRYTETGRSVINNIPSTGAHDRARGGIIGAAGGGPRSNMTLVGEAGPELVRLPFGSSVIPNGQTNSILSQGSKGEGVTVNVYVQGSIRSDRDLIALIRNEFVNGGFRGALSNA